MVCGLYRVMFWNSSSMSAETRRPLKSSGLYAPVGNEPEACLVSVLPSLDSEVPEPWLLLDSSLSLPAPSLRALPAAWLLLLAGKESLPPPPAAALGFGSGCLFEDFAACGVSSSELDGVLRSSSSLSTGIASS